MTPEEYNRRLTDLYGLVSGDLAQDVIVPSAIVMLASIKNRITKQGKNSAGGNIGDYSQKEMWAKKSQFAKPGAFKAEGKYKGYGDRLVPTVLLNQSKKLKRGPDFLKIVATSTTKKYSRYSQVTPGYRERTTMYLQNGYKQLRDIQSLRTDIMNFQYRGDLMRDFQMQKVSQAVLLGFTLDKESKKRQSLEARKGRVFSPTQNEIQAYTDRVNYNLTRLTRSTIEGINVSAAVE